MPVSTSNPKPIGMLTRLNVAVLNDVFAPVTNSESIGNKVPNSTEKAIPTSRRLLKKKLTGSLERISHLAKRRRLQGVIAR